MDSIDKSSICKESVNLIEGNLRHGFHFVDEKILLITEHEIFQKKLKRRFRRQHVSNAERLKDYNELEKGDYVVHHIHGIGQYLGIETIEIKGIHRDYVSVQYQMVIKFLSQWNRFIYFPNTFQVTGKRQTQ